MTCPGRLALVGSGEYLPVMHDIEAWLLDGRPGRYVQLATAAAPEGQKSLDHWHTLGAQAADRLGVEQVVVDVRTAADAENPLWTEAIKGAGLIFLSGGNPSFLARTLAGTAVWRAIEQEWRTGASLAGCSAGAMALGGYVPDFRHPRNGGVDGLGIIPALRVLPHFDRYTKWVPDFAMRPLLSPGISIVGIDEDTALLAESPLASEAAGGDETHDVDVVSDPAIWQFRARGRQSTWRVEADRRYRINGSIALSVRI